MKKTLLGVVLLCGLLGLILAGMAMANSAVDGDEPAMMVSPSLIVLTKVDTVTVHTNIVASAVDAGSIELDGAAPVGIGVDNCGHIVLKFSVADLDLERGDTVLTLSGALTDASSFTATDSVRVK